MSTKVRGHEIADVLDKAAEWLGVRTPEGQAWDDLVNDFASWLGSPDIDAVGLAKALGPDVLVQDPAVMVAMVAELRARAENAEAGSSNMWDALTTTIEAHEAAADEIRDLRAERDAARQKLAATAAIVDRLRARAERLRAERDEARREVCWGLSDGRDYTMRVVAMDRGWSYLYPEDATACASCPGGGGRPHKLGCARRPGQGVRLNVGSPEPSSCLAVDEDAWTREEFEAFAGYDPDGDY